MPGGDRHAERPEPLGGLAGVLVAARDGDLVLQQDLGDAAHAGTADADEMRVAEAREAVEHQAALPIGGSSASIRSTIAAAACGCARRRALSPILASRGAVGEQVRELAGEAIGVERDVLDQARRSGLGQQLRVRQLVGARGDERQQHRRPTGGADLGQGDRPGTRDHQIDRGHRRRDVVDERHDAQARRLETGGAIGGERRFEMGLAALMQDRELRAALEQRREHLRHEPVDAQRALAAAEHQQARLAVRAQRRDLEEGGAHRDSGNPGKALEFRRGGLVGDGGSIGEPRRPAVGKPCFGVGLDQDRGPVRETSAEHRRRRGVAAGADHQIEATLADLPARRERREGEGHECGELRPETLAEERPRRQRHERQAAFGGEARLHAGGRTGQGYAPAPAHELVADRERREDMPAGTAPGEQGAAHRGVALGARVSHAGTRSAGRRR